MQEVLLIPSYCRSEIKVWLFLKVIGDGIGFARELFSNMREGLFYEKVASSQTESLAIMRAFMECLRYALFNFNHENVKDEPRKTTEDEDNGNLIEYLINEEVSCLTFSNSHFAILWRSTHITLIKNGSFFQSLKSPSFIACILYFRKIYVHVL